MADLSSLSDNFFTVASETFTDNLSSSILAGATTVPVNSAVEYTEGDCVALTVDPGTANEATFVGKKDSGNQFIECVWTEGNTAVGHDSGATIIDYDSASHHSAQTKGMKVEHEDDGTHKNIPAITNPTGSIIDYAGASAPTGWLLAYGQAVSRTTYAALYAIIGDTYGAGDGSTTFNLPDLRGRVVAGQDDMGGVSANRLTNPGTTTGGIDGDTLGGTGGAETHTLLTGELATHTHTTKSTGSSSGTPNHQDGTGGYGLKRGNADYFGQTNSTYVGNAGSDTAHNNVQPTIILNKIIKT